MTPEIIHTALLGIAFLVLFAFAELLYHVFKIKVEYTRKLVHIGTGILTLLFPLYIGNAWLVLLLVLTFILILALSLRYNQFKSVNAIDRKSSGSIAYPVAVMGCYLAYDFFNHQLLYFYLPILILAICDPVAALTGKRWPWGAYQSGGDKKSLTGSFMFFLSAFLIGMVLFQFVSTDLNMSQMLLTAMVVALMGALAEAIGNKGYDNITIPIAVIMGIYITTGLH